MFAPDSESAVSLLTSLTLMCEKYNGKKYLAEAEFCADYFASWVPAVQYSFPEGSTLDQLEIDCRGAVQANLQNQHGAPGPCIDSANALYLLYRLTGKEKYLLLLREIIHNCVQYISTKNTPIPMKNGSFLPEGDISEKVMFQDYGRNCGYVPSTSGGWTECAVLMCISENPSIYCRAEDGFLMVFDHVDAALKDGVLSVENPFSYPVEIRLAKETCEAMKQPAGVLPFLHYESLTLEAHEKIVLKV